MKKKDVAEYLRVSNAFITQLAKGDRGIPQDKLAEIKQNEIWDTSMLKFPSEFKSSEGDSSSPSNRTDVPMIGGQVVAYDAESYAEALSKYGDDLVPEYNAEFRGGRSGATLDQADIIAHWTIPNAPKGSFIITMRGNSMSPEIASGARLLLAPMNFDKSNPCSIPFGRVFGIVVASEDSTEPPMAYIKILRRHTDKSLERRFWIARSVNTQLFDDFDIPVERVTHLYKLLYAINPMWGL